MDNPAALHRIKVGVPATVEHSSEAGPETAKQVAETTQVKSLTHSQLYIDF
jgi:ESCRT-I complex subunit VPS28